MQATRYAKLDKNNIPFPFISNIITRKGNTIEEMIEFIYFIMIMTYILTLINSFSHKPLDFYHRN